MSTNIINGTNSKYIWEEFFIDTYSQPSFVIERGESSYLFDTDGHKYLDFTSGFGASSLGYSNDNLKCSLKNQIDLVLHSSNLFFNKPMLMAGEKIVKASNMSKVYFCNSGTEANETAFKIIRKYSSEKYGNKRGTIISLINSFHGRTMMSLMATGMDKYHQYFYPMPKGHKYVEVNNIDSFLNNIDETVCGVILEAIQGEGGVNPLNKSYVNELVKICLDRDIAVIFDEIQCGIGRTGKMFGYEKFDVKADIITVAKGLSAGIPVGVVLVSEKFSNVLKKGDQGTTFGGNPLAMTAANVVLDEIESPGFYDDVNEKGDYIKDFLWDLNSDKIIDIRGDGLMIGVEVNIEASTIKEEALKRGLLVLTAGKNNVIRFLPPLNITYKEIDEALIILKDCFK